jgi:hypothetical protein
MVIEEMPHQNMVVNKQHKGPRIRGFMCVLGNQQYNELAVALVIRQTNNKNTNNITN